MNTLTMVRTSQPLEQPSAHTVLVVEDELMVRLPIAEYLRDCGYKVVEAADAAEAIAAVDVEGPVSIVFSDVRMPGSMDGFDLAHWFQVHHPDVPVLLTSGYNASRAVQTSNGASTRMIPKPYSQSLVARKIAALLER